MQNCCFPKFSFFSRAIFCTKRHKLALPILLCSEPSLPDSPPTFSSLTCSAAKSYTNLSRILDEKVLTQKLLTTCQNFRALRESRLYTQKAASEKTMLVRVLWTSCMTLMVLSSTEITVLLRSSSSFGSNQKPKRCAQQSREPVPVLFVVRFFFTKKAYSWKSTDAKTTQSVYCAGLDSNHTTQQVRKSCY